MTSRINYGETPQFQKDFKKLYKRYKTLIDDFKVAKEAAIELYHLQKVNNLSIFPIPGFCTSEIQICKLKKFACKSLKGRGSRSGIRVIYAFDCNNFQIDFIEIYFKGDKENEDRERIQEYFKKLEWRAPEGRNEKSLAF